MFMVKMAIDLQFFYLIKCMAIDLQFFNLIKCKGPCVFGHFYCKLLFYKSKSELGMFPKRMNGGQEFVKRSLHEWRNEKKKKKQTKARGRKRANVTLTSAHTSRRSVAQLLDASWLGSAQHQQPLGSADSAWSNRFSSGLASDWLVQLVLIRFLAFFACSWFWSCFGAAEAVLEFFQHKLM